MLLPGHEVHQLCKYQKFIWEKSDKVCDVRGNGGKIWTHNFELFPILSSHHKYLKLLQKIVSQVCCISAGMALPAPSSSDLDSKDSLFGPEWPFFDSKPFNPFGPNGPPPSILPGLQNQPDIDTSKEIGQKSPQQEVNPSDVGPVVNVGTRPQGPIGGGGAGGGDGSGIYSGENEFNPLGPLLFGLPG